MDLSNFFATALILFIVTTILGFFVFLIKGFALNRQLQAAPMTSRYWGQVLTMMCGTMGDALFWFLAVISWYWWIFFKGQEDIYVLLPTSDPHPMWTTVIIVVIVTKTVEMVGSVAWNVGIDIFFIDWEKPRDQRKAKEKELPAVSVWRSIFLTNEWNELGADRLVSLELTLFLVLLFLKGLDLEYLATPQPSSSDKTPGPTNWTLDFAVAVFFWIVSALAQVLYKKVMFHFGEDPCANFVDLLSLANISVIIFDSRYHGYYLHGRSVHQYADATMQEMATQLKMEEEGQVFKRGLAPNSEDQVFEIFVTKEFRDKYDALFMAPVMQAEAAAKSQPDKKSRPFQRAQIGGAQMMELVLAKDALNQHLQKFISEIQGNPGAIRDKSKSFQALGLPPEMSTANSAMFYTDRRNVFNRVFPLGQEHRLLVFDMVMYTMWRMISGDVFLAALLTFVTQGVVGKIREKLMQDNLAAKTLVDDRFLI